MKNQGYRADIDGMRAIAVLAIVIFHINKRLLPGGFVGVDIFFVISGYLITSQVLQKIADGTFTLQDFYRRRINRLLPALIVLLVSVLAVGAVLLSPLDLIRLAKSATLSVVGLSNFYLWHEYGGYFDSGSAEAPLLHTWSLAVEEQFYLIWPMVLVFLCRRKSWSAAHLWTALLLFIGVSEIGVRYAQSASYYLLPTRFFEPLMGAVLGFTLTRPGAKIPDKGISNFAGALGLFLIAGSIFCLDETAPFPGLYALPGTIGAALVILGGQCRDSVSARLLAFPPLVFVGVISYSVYLWHWPIVAYLTYFGGEIGPVERLAMFIGALAMGWLSWRFVEQRFRYTVQGATQLTFFVKRFVGPFVAIGLVLVACIGGKGFPQRWNSKVMTYDEDVSTRPDQIRVGCHVTIQRYRDLPKDSCVLGDRSKKPEGIMIGDSFANHFTGMVDVLASHDGIALQDYTMDGCAPIEGFSSQRQASYASKCVARNTMQYDMISKSHYRYVVLAAHWPADDADGTVAHKFALSVDRILSSGAHLIIVLPNQMIDGAATCPIRKVMYGSSRDCSESQPPRLPQYLRALMARPTEITFIDPNSVICGHGRCDPVVSDTPLYRDDGHLNDVGSRLIGTLLVSRGVTLKSHSSEAPPGE